MDKDEKELEKKRYLDELKETKEEIDKTLAEIKEERARIQELKADDYFSGKSQGGKPSEEKKPEMSNAEYADLALRGIVPPKPSKQ